MALPFSLVFSATNVITVLSAPLRSVVSVPQKIGWTGYAADGNNTGYYRINASGAGPMDVFREIWGYYF